MSEIKNTPPETGDTLTHTALNSLFSDFATQTTTAMNADNCANEAVDIPSLDLDNTDGQAGLICVDYDTNTIGSSSATVVAAKDATGAPVWSIVSNAVSYGSSGKAFLANDLARYYFHLNVSNQVYATPFLTTPLAPWNRFCWGVWLEYAQGWSAGAPASWTAVPNQSNMTSHIATSAGTEWYGAEVGDMAAMALIPNQMTYLDSSVGVHQIPLEYQNFSGQYYNKFGSNATWYGIRLRIGGLFYTFNDGTDNMLAYISGFVNTGNTLAYKTGNITLINMRSV